MIMKTFVYMYMNPDNKDEDCLCIWKGELTIIPDRLFINGVFEEVMSNYVNLDENILVLGVEYSEYQARRKI